MGRCYDLLCCSGMELDAEHFFHRQCIKWCKRCIILKYVINSLTATGAYICPIFDKLCVRLIFSAKNGIRYTFDGSVESPFPPLQFVRATLPRRLYISDPILRGVEVILLSFVFGAILVGSYILLRNFTGNYIWNCNLNITARKS